MNDEFVIGVTLIHDDFTQRPIGTEISVCRGFKRVDCIKSVGKDIDTSMHLVIELARLYNCKVMYENNLHSIYAWCKDKGLEDYLMDTPDILTKNPFSWKRTGNKSKGICITADINAVFSKNSHKLVYNRLYEDSYKIAVLPALINGELDSILTEIRVLKDRISELELKLN